MTIINGKPVKVCLLDTCALSEILKENEKGKLIMTEISDKDYVFGISIMSIYELREAKNLYEKFFKLCSTIPIYILENFHGLIKKEMNCFPEFYLDFPQLFCLETSRKKEYYDRIKDEAFENEMVLENIRTFQSEKKYVLNTIKKHSNNFNPQREFLKKKFIETWSHLVTLKILNKFDYNLTHVEERHLRKNFALLPSIKSLTLTIFYSYYEDLFSDKRRKPDLSDIVDIIISSLYSYVDTIILENNKAEIARKIQNKHSLFPNLIIKQMREFKKK